MSEFPLLTIRDLSVIYRDGSHQLEALAGVDLDLAAGHRLAVIGESGSGKSSFGLALAGLLPPNAIMAGRVTWPSLRRDPVLGRDIGFVFQDASGSLDPMMRVGDQIAEVCGTHLSLSRAQARAQAIELLARVKLPDPSRAARAFPHQLSGGQRQRVAIAAAIAARPRLLIADEPTSALDSVVQAEIVALIQELVHQDAMALVFITHDIALAAQIADTIAVFYAARLVEAGAARRVMTRPEHPYTVALLATHLGLDRATARPLPTVEGAPPDPAAPSPGCRFAPRCPESEASCSIEPAWRGTLGDGAACIHAGQHARSNAFPYKATAR